MNVTTQPQQILARLHEETFVNFGDRDAGCVTGAAHERLTECYRLPPAHTCRAAIATDNGCILSRWERFN